jgi:rod shape-determining protein MreC
VKGTPTGEVQLTYIMGDESVKPGEALVTSGGDRVFPKGLPIGTVAKVSVGRNLFLDIKLKPAVDLDRLEEVLVITEQKPRAPDVTGLGAIRAADILAGHLPGVPAAPAEAPQPASPAVPKTAFPAAPKTASPAVPKTVAPAVPKTASPAAPKTGAMAAPKTASPVAPKTGAPNADSSKPKPAATEGTQPR